MKGFKQIFDFYLNSSIHVALAAYAMTWITLIQFNIKHNENLLYFVFFATVTGYNFVKYFGVAKFHHRRLAGWLRAIQIFSFFAFVGLCFYLFQLHVNTLIYISIFGLITFLYAMPLLPMRYFRDKQMNLRQISGLKIYVIALVWAFVTVFFPFVEYEIIINWDVIIAIVQRFIFVMVLMLPFEVRDLKYDNLKLATIPQQIGIKKTKGIGIMLLLVFVLLEFFTDELTITTVILNAIISIIAFLFLLFSNENQSKYYSAFWVEGIPVYWLILLLIFG